MILYDVIIIGGGPAGLNAAVILGRCRRKVLVFDAGQHRNKLSHGIHNYLSRDGILPADFHRLARMETQKYGVHFKKTEIETAEKKSNGLFRVKDVNGSVYQSRKLLVATGLRDRLPAVEGFEQFYGSSIFHCPYCDAWEVKDKRIGVYAKNRNGVELALALTTWSDSVTYYTDGRRTIKEEDANVLEKYRIPWIKNSILKLQGTDRKLKSIVMKNNEQFPCDALFFVNGYIPQSHLVEKLGCILTKQKAVITNRYQQTNIPGVYVAGDASRDMHFVVVAAAEGARAGVTINKELQKEEKIK